MSKDKINSLQDLDGEDYTDIRTKLQETILSLYLPAANDDEVEEFISNGDLLDTMRGMLEMESEYLFLIMQELGFKTKLIEDNVYWMVKLV